MSPRVVVYSTTYCGYCVRAKMLLNRKGIAFTEMDVTDDDAKRAWLVTTTGRRTVPQIFIDDKPIGGFDELAAQEVVDLGGGAVAEEAQSGDHRGMGAEAGRNDKPLPLVPERPSHPGAGTDRGR